MASSNNKSIVKKESSSLPVVQGAPTGFEDIDLNDIPIPRIRLLQALSSAVVDETGKAGQFENSLTKEVVSGPIEVIPLAVKRGAVYLSQDKGMVCKSDNGVTAIDGSVCAECPYGEYWKKFHDNGTPPKCSGTIDFVVVDRESLSEDIPKVAAFTFMKTSYKTGKEVVAMARYTGKPLYARSYLIDTKKVESAKGKYYNPIVKPAEFLGQEEFIRAAELAKSFSSRKIEDDHVVAEDSAAPAGDDNF